MRDAATVARNAGVELRAKGSRLWAHCPIHGEKTASLCFFPDGRCHCFGCGFDGDAADLYAALHSVPLAEALRICKGNMHATPLQTKVTNLRQRVEAWYSTQWNAACNALHEASAYMQSMEQAGKAIVNNDAYWLAVHQYAIADDRLHHLISVMDDPIGKTLLYKEASSDEQRTRTA